MPESHHIYVSFDADADGDTFGLPLSQVQEVIRLDGVFGALRQDGTTLDLRRRTVHLIDVEEWLGIQPSPPTHMVVFERNHRLHGLPVTRADRKPVNGYCELDLKSAKVRSPSL